ncbi:MAG: HD domain-containing protein, partial [Endomicrobium sp.]|nr:HD domain-containing protein [Endomicrobium sp.]
NLSEDLAALGCGIKERFEEYFSNPEYAKSEKRILKAAHCLSTKWEFGIIYPWNAMLYGIEKTKQEIDETIASFDDLSGIRKLMINKKYYGFLDLCGQLRFQQRWAQAFRIPKTTVLGHMFTVAIFSYIFSLENRAAPRRIYNNFYCSLFHDLPEILTKDIIRPIKSSISGLEEIIKIYEEKQVNERILPLIPENWRSEMQYFIQDEFSDKITENGKPVKVENAGDYNDDKFNAVDGSLTEMCDKFCAYIEASMALEYGIKSQTLIQSKQGLYEKYSGQKKKGLDFKRLYDYF